LGRDRAQLLVNQLRIRLLDKPAKALLFLLGLLLLVGVAITGNPVQLQRFQRYPEVRQLVRFVPVSGPQLVWLPLLVAVTALAWELVLHPETLLGLRRQSCTFFGMV